MSVAIDQKSPPRAEAVRLSACRRPLQRAVAVISIFCALLIWTLVVGSSFRTIEGPDDAFFAAVAHFWTRGILPYAGAFDIKPPGFFAILAVVQTFLGPSLQTLKTVTIFFDAVTATAVYFIGWRMGSRAVGASAALLYPFLSQFVTNNAPYAPLAAFTTLAFLAALSSLPISKRAALAGLAIGVAFTVKQTAAFEGVALFVILLRAPEAAARRIGVGLVFGAAAAIVPLGFLFYFAAHGVAGLMMTDVVVDALSRPASAIEKVSFIDGVLRSLVYLARPVELIFALACVALLRRRAILAAAPNAAIGALGLWAAAAILSLWAQHSLFMAYLAPAFAPLTLLAGAGVVFAAPELKRVAVPIRLALMGLIAVATVMFYRQIGLDLPQEMHAIDTAARAIGASHPAPNDKLFVVNRGLWLYAATGLAPPTAYIHWEHTLCDFPGAGPDRLADALAAEPRYIVVADRARHVKCELARSWLLVDSALARSYRLLAHAQGGNDFYDVYEAVRTAVD